MLECELLNAGTTQAPPEDLRIFVEVMRPADGGYWRARVEISHSAWVAAERHPGSLAETAVSDAIAQVSEMIV